MTVEDTGTRSACRFRFNCAEFCLFGVEYQSHTHLLHNSFGRFSYKTLASRRRRLAPGPKCKSKLLRILMHSLDCSYTILSLQIQETLNVSKTEKYTELQNKYVVFSKKLSGSTYANCQNIVSFSSKEYFTEAQLSM